MNVTTCEVHDVDRWDDEPCWRCDWVAQFVNGFWVNVYDVARCYGGPEEGGWWYDTGEPVDSVRCNTLEDAEAWAEGLREGRYERTDARYSVLGGEDYNVSIEPHPGRPFPEERPHYE